jgi:hypothetical protein
MRTLVARDVKKRFRSKKCKGNKPLCSSRHRWEVDIKDIAWWDMSGLVLAKMIIRLQVGNILSCWATLTFTRRTLLDAVGYIVKFGHSGVGMFNIFEQWTTEGMTTTKYTPKRLWNNQTYVFSLLIFSWHNKYLLCWLKINKLNKLIEHKGMDMFKVKPKLCSAIIPKLQTWICWKRSI